MCVKAKNEQQGAEQRTHLSSAPGRFKSLSLSRCRWEESASSWRLPALRAPAAANGDAQDKPKQLD